MLPPSTVTSATCANNSSQKHRRKRRKTFLTHRLQPLEPRQLLSVTIAPNGKTATYTDVDGDSVTVAVSKGILTESNLVTAPSGVGHELQVLNLSTGGFSGANVTITAQALGGDGKVNVAYIDSTGNDLGNVSVSGDLILINAGDANDKTVGIKKLSVDTFGMLGPGVGSQHENLQERTSHIFGGMQALVAREFHEASLKLKGFGTGNIGLVDIGILLGGIIEAENNIGQIKVKNSIVGSDWEGSGIISSIGGNVGDVTIGGSLIGGTRANTGRVISEYKMGHVRIGGNIEGGEGNDTGTIRAYYGNIASLTVAGNILGTSHERSGNVFSPSIGTVNVAGSLIGGDGKDSAHIRASAKIGNVTIGGNLNGGAGQESGTIISQASIGQVKVTGNLVGGTGNGSGSIISTSGSIAGVVVNGSILGGGFTAGTIWAETSLGAVTISGNVEGGDGQYSGNIFGGSKVAAVTLGGSLTGGSGDNSGAIVSQGSVGPVKIAQDIRGGGGQFSGAVAARGSNLSDITINGFLKGGAGTKSGTVSAQSNIGKISIAKDIQGDEGESSGCIFTVTGKIAGVSVKGSLLGGNGVRSGTISSKLDLGSVSIGGSVVGLGNETGIVQAFNGKLPSITVAGNLQGGGTVSGIIRARVSIGSVTIGGNIIGGSEHSGYIYSDGNIASVSLGGSLIGGTANSTGGIISIGDLGSVTIGGDFIGGSNSGGGTLDLTGIIQSVGRIASLTIKGSIIVGQNTGSGELARSASILVGKDIGSLTVKNNIVGSIVDGYFTTALILAGGQAKPRPGTNLAIGKISIGGDVTLASIFAGYTSTLGSINADAQIGPVTVAGNWIRSTIAAGVRNQSFLLFGDGNDVKMSGESVIDDPATLSKIMSISIGGTVSGTPSNVNPSDHYGFVAEQIVSLKIGGIARPLTPTAHTDNLNISAQNDVSVFEV